MKPNMVWILLGALVLWSCGDDSAASAPDGDSEQVAEAPGELSCCETPCRERHFWQEALEACIPGYEIFDGLCSPTQDCPADPPMSCHQSLHVCVPDDIGNRAFLLETRNGGCRWDTAVTWPGTDACAALQISDFHEPSLICLKDDLSVVEMTPQADGTIQTKALGAIPGPANTLTFAGSDPRVWYLYGRGSAYRSVDKGVTWQKMFGIDEATRDVSIAEIRGMDENGLHIIARIDDWGLQKSLHGGETWSPGRNPDGSLMGYEIFGGCDKVAIHSWAMTNGAADILARISCRDGNISRYQGLARPGPNLDGWKKAETPSYIGDDFSGIQSVFMSPKGRWRGFGLNSSPDGPMVFIEDLQESTVDNIGYGGGMPGLRHLLFNEKSHYLLGDSMMLRTKDGDTQVIEQGLPWYVSDCYAPVVLDTWIDPADPAHLKICMVYRSKDCLK